MTLKLCNKSIVCISLIIMLFASILYVPSSAVNAQENPHIYSPSIILIDHASGHVLYEKNARERRYPASLTKVIATLVVLERCKLNELATVSEHATTSLAPGYVTANLQVGEQFTIEQLLYLFMIASANDAGIVLAEHVSGSEEAFSILMNEKAKEIGCEDTNFTNPNGIHFENHYSTAYDLALIGRVAMHNAMFRKIVATTSCSLPPTEQYEKDDRYFSASNLLLIQNNNSRPDNYYYRYATGIKTGFTTPAGSCLIASASRDKLELITVVLGSGQTEGGLSERYLDTLSLFDYGYSTYAIQNIARKGQAIQTTSIKNATRDTKRLDLSVIENVAVLRKKDNMSTALSPDIKLKENLKAPIKTNDVIGSVTYTSEGITYTYDLVASSDVISSKVFRNFILIIMIILLTLFYIRYRNLNKRRKRLSRMKQRAR